MTSCAVTSASLLSQPVKFREVYACLQNRDEPPPPPPPRALLRESPPARHFSFPFHRSALLYRRHAEYIRQTCISVKHRDELNYSNLRSYALLPGSLPAPLPGGVCPIPRNVFLKRQTTRLLRPEESRAGDGRDYYLFNITKHARARERDEEISHAREKKREKISSDRIEMSSVGWKKSVESRGGTAGRVFR